MDNVVKGQLGKRIAELRKQSGMTQREMAERLQVTTSALCKWERGQNYPDVEMIARMADLFRVSCDDLINGNIECEEERGVLSEERRQENQIWEKAVDCGNCLCYCCFFRNMDVLSKKYGFPNCF